MPEVAADFTTIGLSLILRLVAIRNKKMRAGGIVLEEVVSGPGRNSRLSSVAGNCGLPGYSLNGHSRRRSPRPDTTFPPARKGVAQ